MIFCTSCWRHNCTSLWRENWKTFPVNGPTYILPLIGFIAIFYFVDLRALGRGSLLTGVLLSSLLWNSAWDHLKKWARSVLYRHITLYPPVPWQVSLETYQKTVTSSEDLLAFPSSLQVTSYWYFSVVPLEIETGMSCCHGALKRCQHKISSYSALYKELQYYLTRVQQLLQHWLKVFRGGFHLHCPFDVFWCADLWLTRGP